jgi:PAS domain S-box-containing protein
MNKKINIQDALLAWLNDEAKAGIILFDADYRILYMNRWFENYFPHKAGEAAGKLLWDIFPNINNKRHRQYLDIALAGKVSVLSSRFHQYFIPIPLRKAEYDTFEFMQQQVTISPLLVDGLVKGGKIVINDVTDRKHQELKLEQQITELQETRETLIKNQQALSRLNDELKKTMAEKDRFFSIIAHDLIGPFNSFLGLTEILSSELNTLSHQQIQNVATLMNKSANNLFELLKNLLDWSRIQRGSMDFQPVDLNLLELVQETVEVIIPSFRKKGVNIHMNIPETISIKADRNMFQTTLRNLVSNALKFTPKGGSVTVSAKHYSQMGTVVSVSDTGIGMDKKRLDDLFKINVNTSRPGTDGEPSTGLGLQLCKEYVEKHGGKIWVESEENKGSTFYFSIP